MDISEYKATLFEPTNIVHQAAGNQSKGEIKRTVAALNEELNKAIQRRGVLVNILAQNPLAVEQPSVIMKVRKQLDSAARNFLPYIKQAGMESHLADCFYSVSNLYDEELQRNKLLFDRQEKEAGEGGVPFDPAKALYVTSGCMVGKIASLERALQLGSRSISSQHIHRDLFHSRYNYLLSGFGVLMKEIDPLLPRMRAIGGATADDTGSGLAASAPDSISMDDAALYGLKSQLVLVKGLIMQIKALENANAPASELAACLHRCDPLMNLTRLQFLGLAHHLFDGIKPTQGAVGSASNRNTEWHSRVFKLCIDAADNLAYLLEHNELGMTRSPLLHVQRGAVQAGVTRPSTHEPSALTVIEPTPATAEEVVDDVEDDASTGVDEKRLNTLLNRPAFNMTDFYLKYLGDYTPESVLVAVEQDCKTAEKLVRSLNSCLESVGGEGELNERINTRINELNTRIEKLQSVEFRNDLLKSYKLPQASHWVELLNNKEVARVSFNKKPFGTADNLFYEVGIHSTPCKVDNTQRVAWLHIHVSKAFPRNLNTEQCWAELRANPENIRAAHLKSDFYHRKGKQWELAQQASGQYDKLVKRSKATGALYQALDSFILTPQAAAAASTGHSR